MIRIIDEKIKLTKEDILAISYVRNVQRIVDVNNEYGAYMAIFKWFNECKIEDYPNLPSLKKPNVDNSVKAVRDLNKIDGFSLVDIIQCLNFALSDDYYSNNIMSVQNIRKKWKNDLTAFESVNKTFLSKKKDKKKSNEPNVEFEYV